jgi:hypothetical protein
MPLVSFERKETVAGFTSGTNQRQVGPEDNRTGADRTVYKTRYITAKYSTIQSKTFLERWKAFACLNFVWLNYYFSDVAIHRSAC